MRRKTVVRSPVTPHFVNDTCAKPHKQTTAIQQLKRRDSRTLFD
jgi:hypothetical protein